MCYDRHGKSPMRDLSTMFKQLNNEHKISQRIHENKHGNHSSKGKKYLGTSLNECSIP